MLDRSGSGDLQWLLDLPHIWQKLALKTTRRLVHSKCQVMFHICAMRSIDSKPSAADLGMDDWEDEMELGRWCDVMQWSSCPVACQRKNGTPRPAAPSLRSTECKWHPQKPGNLGCFIQCCTVHKHCRHITRPLHQNSKCQPSAEISVYRTLLPPKPECCIVRDHSSSHNSAITSEKPGVTELGLQLLACELQPKWLRTTSQDCCTPKTTERNVTSTVVESCHIRNLHLNPTSLQKNAKNVLKQLPNDALPNCVGSELKTIPNSTFAFTEKGDSRILNQLIGACSNLVRQIISSQFWLRYLTYIQQKQVILYIIYIYTQNIMVYDIYIYIL